MPQSPERDAPVKGKRCPLNMRTTQRIRALLDAEAEASGRSLAQTVEFIIEMHFANRRRPDYSDLEG